MPTAHFPGISYFAGMKQCPNCQTALPDMAKFCYNCGAPQPAAAAATPSYILNFQQDVEHQIVEYFFEALKRRVAEEHDVKRYQEYAELLYRSGFRETVHTRAQQLADEARQALQSDGQYAIDRLLNESFEGLLDYFLIRFAKGLYPVQLPEAILKYEGRTLEQIDLYKMTLDYLNFEEEEEPIYLNFLDMPMEKLKNASANFLFPDKSERIFFLCDQSLTNSSKDGFAMTNVALYWKMPFQKAQQVRYTNLLEVKREKDWITINGHFFNVNPNMNMKMLRLLKKLGRLVG